MPWAPEGMLGSGPPGEPEGYGLVIVVGGREVGVVKCLMCECDRVS